MPELLDASVRGQGEAPPSPVQEVEDLQAVARAEVLSVLFDLHMLHVEDAVPVGALGPFRDGVRAIEHLAFTKAPLTEIEKIDQGYLRSLFPSK